MNFSGFEDPGGPARQGSNMSESPPPSHATSGHWTVWHCVVRLHRWWPSASPLPPSEPESPPLLLILLTSQESASEADDSRSSRALSEVNFGICEFHSSRQCYTHYKSCLHLQSTGLHTCMTQVSLYIFFLMRHLCVQIIIAAFFKCQKDWLWQCKNMWLFFKIITMFHKSL